MHLRMIVGKWISLMEQNKKGFRDNYGTDKQDNAV